MLMSATCSGCRVSFRVADSLDGEKIRCPRCQELFRVGSPPAPPEPPVLLPLPDRRRPRRMYTYDEAPAPRTRSYDSTGKPPKSLRRAVVYLLVLAALAVVTVLVTTGVVALQDDEPTRDLRYTLLVLAAYLLPVAAAATGAAILLGSGRSLGRTLGWLVAVLCLPGFPLFTILALGLLGALNSTRLREYLEDEEARPSARNKKVPRAWTLTACLGGAFVLAASAFFLWPAKGTKFRHRGPPQPMEHQTKMSLDGTFDVLMPSGTSTDVEISNGAAELRWGREWHRVSFDVVVTPAAEIVGASDEDLLKVMHARQDENLREFRIVVQFAKNVALPSGQPGRHVEGASEHLGLAVRCRTYAAGDRFITLIASGLTAQSEVDAFLDSLELKPIRRTLTGSLSDARKGFKTQLVRRESAPAPAPTPPPELFGTVRSDSPAGKLPAYLTPDPKDGQKHPAIIWMVGGNSLDQGCWTEGPPGFDTSGSAYRKAGIVMMFPSLRGGHDGIGVEESGLGEVDDVVAAADFLARQPYVDPTRIFLGGHGHGGTLALLVSECSGRFRAVFTFGATHDLSDINPAAVPFDTTDPRETELRSPGLWLRSITTPTFVFDNNSESLQAMAKSSTNLRVRFFPLFGGNYVEGLEPMNRRLADKILRDVGPSTNLTVTDDDVDIPALWRP